MTRERRRSGSFPSIPPGSRVTIERWRVTIELQSGISHPVPFADGLAKCDAWDIEDCDQDAPTVRILPRTGT